MAEPYRCPRCDEISYRCNAPPDQPLVKIHAMRCHQKEKIYYLTDLEAQKLDMLTDVPRFDWNLSYENMADTILKYGHGLEEVKAWQRELIEGKLLNIAKWWEGPNTSLVNNAVISFKESVERPVLRRGQIVWVDVSIRETSVISYHTKELVTIEIDSWLSSVCPEGHDQKDENGETLYVDRCQNHDCDYHLLPWRPAYVIDGQHRIKGIQTRPSWGSSLSPGVNEEKIPVAILGYTEATDAGAILPSEQAKIFTEISGKATPLEKRHKLFLFYVFKTGVPGEDMSEPSRAINPLRNAYEVVLRLAGRGIARNPFQDRIKVLDPVGRGIGRTTALSFDRALKEWFEPWFKSGGIWEHTIPINAAKEMVHLANAIRYVWSGIAPTSGNSYWQPDPPPAPTGVFSHPGGAGDMSAFLRLFFDLYPLIRQSVTQPTENNFRELLRKNLHNRRTAIGVAAWDGPGWDEIRAPDHDLSLLRNVLRDIFSGQTRIRYDLRNHPGQPSNINAYLTLEPTVYEVRTTFGGVPSSGCSLTASQPIPTEIEISWRTPLLARKQVILEVRESDKATISPTPVDVTPGDRTTYHLYQSEGHYSGTSGSKVLVELRAQNHKGVQDRALIFEIEF